MVTLLRLVSILLVQARVFAPLMFMAHEPQMPAGDRDRVFQRAKSRTFGMAVKPTAASSVFHGVSALRSPTANLTFSAGPAESQGGIHFILDLDQGIQNHRATSGTRTHQLPERDTSPPFLFFFFFFFAPKRVVLLRLQRGGDLLTYHVAVHLQPGCLGVGEPRGTSLPCPGWHPESPLGKGHSLLEVQLVRLHAGLLPEVIRGPAVHGEPLQAGRRLRGWRCCCCCRPGVSSAADLQAGQRGEGKPVPAFPGPNRAGEAGCSLRTRSVRSSARTRRASNPATATLPASLT